MKIKRTLSLCLAGVMSVGLLSACGDDEYINTASTAYAVVDNYFSCVQKTQYSGAVITEIEVVSNKAGKLAIGKAKIGKNGTIDATVYEVNEGENEIRLITPLAIGADETLVLGGGETNVKLQTENEAGETEGAVAKLTNGALSPTFTHHKNKLDIDVEATYTLGGVEVDEDEYVYAIGKENLSLALAGLNMSVMGDSISTFEGWNNDPSNNNTIAGNKVAYPSTEIPTMDSADKTYWKLTADNYGMNILVNNSWSGSKVAIASSPKSAACMGRAQNLHANTGEKAGANPDIIAVYMGTNDNHSSEVRCGTFTDVSEIYDGMEYKRGVTFDFAPAYAVMLHKMKTAYPNAKIFCFTTWHNLRHAVSDEDKAEYDQAIRDVAAYFNAEVVDLARNSGISREDFFTYADDGLHPNEEGMKVIAKLFERVLIKSYR